jgi:S-adenosylmethionine synthetase
MAFVDRFIGGEEEYFNRKEGILKEIEDFVRSKKVFQELSVQLNTLDTPGTGEEGIYLTVLGTSGEQGDSGEVGRGNRVNGLISLNRPQCSEAAAGKNPVSHVGKIYNLLSHKIAQEIYSQVRGVREVYVRMLSEIGRPIDQPAIASVQTISMPSISEWRIKKEAERIVDCNLENIDSFCTDLTNGILPVC